MRPKAIDHIAPTSTSTTRSCEWTGCYLTTREGKPFCPEHVESHPYVRQILSILAQRRDEEERVRKSGSTAVDTNGLTARELVLHLSLHGSRTVERLSREFQIETQVMLNYVAALKREGRVVLGRTTRGSTVVRLAG